MKFIFMTRRYQPLNSKCLFSAVQLQRDWMRISLIRLLRWSMLLILYLTQNKLISSQMKCMLRSLWRMTMFYSHIFEIYTVLQRVFDQNFAECLCLRFATTVNNSLLSVQIGFIIVLQLNILFYNYRWDFLLIFQHLFNFQLQLMSFS